MYPPVIAAEHVCRKPVYFRILSAGTAMQARTPRSVAASMSPCLVAGNSCMTVLVAAGVPVEVDSIVSVKVLVVVDPLN